MTLPAPIYDLVMLLDPDAEETTRAKLVADARAAIEAQGEFLRHNAWGNRALSYPIERRNVAEYHLLQFHAHTPALLSTLDRSLRIADEVLRFRIVKLKPGTPDAPDMHAAPAPAPPRRGVESDAAPRPAGGPAAPAAPAAAQAQADAPATERPSEGEDTPAAPAEGAAPEPGAEQAS